ncbi:hypothetical protein P8C59_005131 [Phyllachora maydis]|uniref:Uncharacterized protein n=1 Tax=Phyllachora maydis TaxID=1825666 RepID=A0AAD9I3P8_9PEZI|nr:hypothetical protein P8C59_005131 [Phyllachora maydis]
MGGLLILLALSVVMALASFLAGALPLSMTLSQSQLRLTSSIGIGILVGTALIVIIPEGIEAVATTSGSLARSHQPRHAQILWNRDRSGLAEGEQLVGLTKRRRTFLYVAMHAHAQQEDGGNASHEHPTSNGYTEGTNFNQRKQAKPQMRDTLATVAGMLFPLLTQFGHHH